MKLLFAMLAAMAALIPASVMAQTTNAVPKGVFSLGRAGVPASDQALSNPDVVGISIRLGWRNIEPVEDQYDWSFFDSEIARAKAAGKKVLLRVPAGGINTPAWVFDLGVKTFTFTDSNPYRDTFGQAITIPIFWDTIFLTKKKKLITAMGTRYAKDPTVAIVVASGANATSDDWNVPTSDADIKLWKTLGYTSDKLASACKKQIDATVAAFPQQFVVMAVGQNGALDATPDTVARSVVSYALGRYPGKFIVQKNNLATDIPDPLLTPNLTSWRIMNDSEPFVGAQMLWYVSGDLTGRMNDKVVPFDPLVTLQRAVEIGMHYRVNYQEIYEQDVLNPDLAGVIRYAATNLKTPVTTPLSAGWTLNGPRFADGAAGPTLPEGWSVRGLADFDGDAQVDYVLFHAASQRTAIWYLNHQTFVRSAEGPQVPVGFELIACADFNKDFKPDFVLINRTTRQTLIWQMNDAQFVRSTKGPAMPPKFDLVGCADFNRDGSPDYALFNPSTRQTSIWYMDGNLQLGTAAGPKLEGNLIGVGDFNKDLKPDFVVLNPTTGETTIRYLNGVVSAGKVFGPTLPKGATFGGVADFNADAYSDYVFTYPLTR